MSQPCQIVKLPGGGTQSFDSKKKALDFVTQNADVYDFLSKEQFIQLHANSQSNLIAQTQNGLLQRNQPVLTQIHSKDRFFYNSGKDFQVVNLEAPASLDAPTLQLHREGQDFVNSAQFKSGTPVHFIYSEKTPYNQEYGFLNFRTLARENSDKLRFTKLTAVVFTDTSNNPYPLEVTQDFKLMRTLLEEGKAQVKYVGSFHEFAGATNQSNQALRQALQKKAIEYKKKIGETDGIVTNNDIIHYSPAVTEEVKFLAGFNRRINYEEIYTDQEGNLVSKDTPGAQKQVQQKFKNLSVLSWFNKEVVPLLGIVRRKDKDPGSQYLELNNGNLIEDQSLFYNLNNGDVHLLLPSNINTGKSYVEKGQHYFPIRMITKSWGDNPIFAKRFEGIIKKIFRGDINYDVVKIEGKYQIINVVDNSTIKFNDGKDYMQNRWVDKIWNNEGVYSRYNIQFEIYADSQGIEPTKENLKNYLKTVNPKISGEVYSSLFAEAPINVIQALREFIGMQEIITKDFVDILTAAKKYKSDYKKTEFGDNADALYQKFFQEDTNIVINNLGEPTTLSNKRSQVSVEHFNNQKYLKNYIYKYGVLITNLADDRPTGDLTFWTEQVKPKSDLIKPLFSSTIDQETLSVDQARVWAQQNFPGFEITFYDKLIEDLYNGYFDRGTKMVGFAKDFISTGVLKEEFGHAIFDQLSPEQQKQLFLEVAERTGIPLTSEIELEEALMQIVRADPRDLPDGFIKRFIAILKEILNTLFNQRDAIQLFSDRFHSGYYKNVKPKKISEGVRYSLSPEYSALNNERRKEAVNIINRNYLPEILDGNSINFKLNTLKLINNLKGDDTYDISNSLEDLYDDVKNHIRSIIRDLAKQNNELNQSDISKLESLLRLMNEPALHADLRADLANSYGLKINYDIYDLEQDKLGIVKETEADVIQKLGINLRVLLYNIPDTISADNVEGDPNNYVLQGETKKIVKQTDVRNLKGVSYNKISNLFTFNFNLKDRVESLLRQLNSSNSIEEMLSKLQDLSEKGDPWLKVLRFKLQEEKELGKSLLETELWEGIGQLHFLEEIYRYSYKNNDFLIGSSNIVYNEKSFANIMMQSVEYYGFDSTGERISKDLLKKDIDWVLKAVGTYTSAGSVTTRNFFDIIPQVFQKLGFNINEQNIKNMAYGFKEPGRKNIVGFKTTTISPFLATLSDLALSLQKNNYQYDFIRGDNSEARKLINSLASVLSSAGNKQYLTSYKDSENNQRQSYHQPNFLLRKFKAVLKNPSLVSSYYKKLFGLRYNPLLDLVLSSHPQFDLKKYGGNKKVEKSWENLSTTERVIDLINIGIQAKNSKEYLGNFWIGNLSDSPTAYLLQAPFLDNKEIINKSFGLVQAELDYLFSKLEDKNFNKNKIKGFLIPGMNELIFGKSELTVTDLSPEYFNNYRTLLLEKQDKVLELIAKDMQTNFSNFYKEFIEKPNLFETRLKKVKETRNVSDNGGISYKEQTVTVEVESDFNLFASHVTPEFIENWYYNTTFYQSSSLGFLILHPYFGSDYGDISKRLKQIHTDGRINNLKGNAKFVMLKDKFSKSSSAFLNSIEEELPELYREISKKAFENNNETDSAAYGSLAFLRKTDSNWDSDKEALYQAELNLDIKTIQELSAKGVVFQPTKFGVYAHEEQQAGYLRGEEGYKILSPSIQKYMIKWSLPSQVYRTIDNELIRPDQLAARQGMLVSQVYQQYKTPDLAKLEFELFKLHDQNNGIDYAYYSSGAKFGNFGMYDLEQSEKPLVREIEMQDLKIVTEQPNKNDLKARVLGSQSRFQIPGMIEDEKTYSLGFSNIPGYSSELSGEKLRELFEKALALDMQEEIENISFLSGNEIDFKELSLFLLEKARNSTWNTSETINSIDLNASNTNFKIRPYSSNNQITFMNAVNSAINKILEIKTNSPAFKNVAYTGGLQTKLIGTPENRGLEVECRIAKWPELIEYQRRKLETSGKNLNDARVWFESDEEIIQELNQIGFLFVSYRIPTEFAYSYIRLKIKDFSPNHSGNGIELSKEMTTQTGFDFDADALFTLISQINYRGDQLQLVSPGLESKAQRQSLYARIYDQVLRKKGNEQRIPGEYNRLDLLAENEKLPNYRPGTLEYNLEYQKLNDLASNAIGPKAVVLTVSTFIKGHFQNKPLSFVKPYPVLDKNYGNSLTNWITDTKEGPIAKLHLLAQGVSAAVNMPKNATLSKLKLNKELSAVLDVMTMMRSTEEYSIKFLQYPVIQDYIAMKDTLAVKYQGWEYFSKLNELKRVLLGISKKDNLEAFLYDEANLLSEISLESLNSKTANSEQVFAKFLLLKDRSVDFSSLTINFQRLTKAQEPRPELIRDMLIELKELSSKFINIENLMPVIQHTNNEFSLKNLTGIPVIDQAAKAFLLKIKTFNAITTYFHPKFIEAITVLDREYLHTLSNSAWLSLNEYMRRAVKSKQVKPLGSLLHLGKRGIAKEDGIYYFPGSLGFVRNYVQNLFNAEDNIKLRGDYNQILSILSYLGYSKNPIYYKEEGFVKETRDLQLISGIFQDSSFIENFEGGFMKMIKSSDPILRQFAEDLRDFSIYKGWSRANNNWGPLIPASVWENYENKFDQDLNTFGVNGFLELAVLNNPEEFLPTISYGKIKKYYTDNNLKNLNLTLGFQIDANSVGVAGKFPKMLSLKLKEVIQVYKHTDSGNYVRINTKGSEGFDDFTPGNVSVIVQPNESTTHLIPENSSTVSTNKKVLPLTSSNLLEEPMDYEMKAENNIYGEDTTTFAAIVKGDRTSTTRGYWHNVVKGNLKSVEDLVGKTIVFTNKQKEKVQVVVDSVHKITKADRENPEFLTQWSKTEGWAAEYLLKETKPGEYQVKFHKKEDPSLENDSINFTQEQLDVINTSLAKIGTPAYTLEQLNNLPQDRKAKALEYYKKCMQ